MLLKDQITELETIDENDSVKCKVWLNNFNAAALAKTGILLEEFYSAYHKAKNLLGFKEQETISPMYWSPSSITTASSFSSPSPISYQFSYQLALGEAIAEALASFSLSVTKSDEEQQSLTAFLNAEYAYLLTYFSIDTRVYGKKEICWIEELSEEPYLQNCLKWFLFSFRYANSDNATNLLFLTLNQLIKNYFKDPAHLLLDILVKKLNVENSLQNEFYFNAILKCLLSGQTPYPLLKEISMVVVKLNILAQTRYEEVLVRYLRKFNHVKEGSESPEVLAWFMNISNEFLRYELLKFRSWLWSEHVLSELSVGKLIIRPFANSESAIRKGKEILVECELRDILKILNELEIAPNAIQLLIACKLIATEPLTNESWKTKWLLLQKPLLKSLYTFFADTSKTDFGKDTAPRLNPALWEPINLCVKERSNEFKRPEKRLLDLVSLKENIASFFHTPTFSRGIIAARQSISEIRSSHFSNKQDEHLTFYSGYRVDAIDI